MHAMRVGAGELVASAASASLVVAVLASADARVRAGVAHVLHDPAAATGAGRDWLVELSQVLWVAAREQTAEHAPLVVLAAVGAILLVLLSRV